MDPNMKTNIYGLACSAIILASVSVFAKADPDPKLVAMAMNAPDQLSWTLFLNVVADSKGADNNNALFETWASDKDTFSLSPVWPEHARPLALKARALEGPRQEVISRFGDSVVTPLALPSAPGQEESEEVRRNKISFDFIVREKLFRRSGLIEAFGKPLSFPPDAIEVKANWFPIDKIPGFSGSEAEAGRLYHVNTVDRKSYALVSVHVISKLVPNWTWATFEHKSNPSRCDVIGCSDKFGATRAYVAPAETADQGYPNCDKTAALTTMLDTAKIDPAFKNYCLKGSQVDFTDATGRPTRLGNSITERGFVAQSSCLTCHGQSAFGPDGKSTGAGFDPVTKLPWIGPLDPSLFWSFTGPPYRASQNLADRPTIPNIRQIAQPTDFVWSIPFCAVDDVTDPAKPVLRCQDK